MLSTTTHCILVTCKQHGGSKPPRLLLSLSLLRCYVFAADAATINNPLPVLW